MPRLTLDEDIRVVAWAESLPGKAALLVLFMAALRLLGPRGGWLAVTAAAAASAFSGNYRGRVAPLATLALLLLDPFWFGPNLPKFVAAQEGVDGRVNFLLLRYATLAAVFIFSAAVLYCKRRFQDLLVSRRCVSSLIFFFFGLVALANSGALRGMPKVMLWSFIGGLGAYFWFLCYALLDQNSKDRGTLPTQLGWFHPFWGSSSTPFGKGAANLREMEARTPRQLAISQLSGIQLLFWCLAAQLSLRGFMVLVHHRLGVPMFDAALARQLAGAPYHWSLCWASLISSFFESVLSLMVWGNTIVACARMAGFKILRNTYRPFQARTVAAFWNRYYFYFKELLADFFFYPTFTRCFKNHKRLRIFFATFMAACVGNLIFHFIRDIAYVAELGLLKAMVGYQTIVFYSILLAGAIGISHLREPKTEVGAGWFRATAWPMLRVTGTFCMLHIFADLRRDRTLLDHFYFLSHLFGFN